MPVYCHRRLVPRYSLPSRTGTILQIRTFPAIVLSELLEFLDYKLFRRFLGQLNSQLVSLSLLVYP